MMGKKQKILSRGTSTQFRQIQEGFCSPGNRTGGCLERAGRKGEEYSQLKMECVRKLPRDRDERH